MSQDAFEHWFANDLPFERVVTSGAKALETWKSLKASGRGMPVVIGDDQALRRVAEGLFDWRSGTPLRPEEYVAKTLEMAASLEWPQAIRDVRRAEYAAFGDINLEDARAPVGDWPAKPPGATGLQVAQDASTGQFLERVTILILPAKDATEAPAYLNWGAWNSCPEPAYHVAALRSWSSRYGVELVGASGDVLNLIAERTPQSREEALALAHEQYDYCADIVEQGDGTVSALASGLMASKWWFFWWD